MSSHFARAAGSEMRTFRKSSGTLCTAPGEIACLVMDFVRTTIVQLLFYVLGSLKFPCSG
jgi:hypothetical protein